MDLLLQHLDRIADEDEAFRLDVRRRLESALHRLLPGIVVWVYGSLTRPGRFHRESSDIDLALESLPDVGPGLYLLQSLLSAATGVPVDICLLGETRLEPEIRSTGERWMPSPSQS